MDKCVLEYGMIIMFIIIIYLFINLKKCIKKTETKENFALSTDDLSMVRNEINRIYNMDVEAIRNLGAISKSLLTGTNTFTPSTTGTPGDLTIPADNTKLLGNVEIIGQLKIGSTIILANGDIKAGTTTILANGDIKAGTTTILANGDIKAGATTILANGDIKAGKTTIWVNGDIRYGSLLPINATVQLPSIGGPGGIPYQTLCPSGKLLMGLNIRGGNYVDNVQGICQ